VGTWPASTPRVPPWLTSPAKSRSLARTVKDFERPRRDTVVLSKHLAEVVPVAKTALRCNFLHRELAACGQSRGLVDPEFGQIASRCYSTRLLELSREMESVHLGDASHVLDTNEPRQVEPAEPLDLADKHRHRLC